MATVTGPTGWSGVADDVTGDTIQVTGCRCNAIKVYNDDPTNNLNVIIPSMYGDAVSASPIAPNSSELFSSEDISEVRLKAAASTVAWRAVNVQGHSL
jgi:hypothetical protein